MAYRCPDCNRFVSTEIEISDSEINSLNLLENMFDVDLTLNLSRVCAECGAELATKSIDITLDTKIDPDDLKGDWESSL